MRRKPSDLEREAVALAVNGFSVFPLRPGTKKPIAARRVHPASADPIEVADYWQSYPSANIGVQTGGGTIVIDSDPEAEKGGLTERLAIPDTMSVRTPRGGRHFYLLAHSGSRVGVRPGLDVRGKGGYAVGPGSRVGERPYEWIVPPWELGPQPAPNSVLELLRERAARTALDDAPIRQGCRNHTLTRVAGALVRVGVRGEALGLALHAANRTRCKPPLPESEVENVIKSANKWKEPPPWTQDPLGFAEDPRLDGTARHLLLVLAEAAHDDGTVLGGEWLERRIGVHRNTVGRAAKKLEKHGRVQVLRKPNHANIYRLLPAPLPVNIGSSAPERCNQPDEAEDGAKVAPGAPDRCSQ